jgi:hypothetical protein
MTKAIRLDQAIPLTYALYRASLGINPRMWMSWIKANGFSVDSNNMLTKDGNTYMVDAETKSLISIGG